MVHIAPSIALGLALGLGPLWAQAEPQADAPAALMAEPEAGYPQAEDEHAVELINEASERAAAIIKEARRVDRSPLDTANKLDAIIAELHDEFDDALLQIESTLAVVNQAFADQTYFYYHPWPEARLWELRERAEGLPDERGLIRVIDLQRAVFASHMLLAATMSPSDQARRASVQSRWRDLLRDITHADYMAGRPADLARMLWAKQEPDIGIAAALVRRVLRDIERRGDLDQGSVVLAAAVASSRDLDCALPPALAEPLRAEANDFLAEDNTESAIIACMVLSWASLLTDDDIALVMTNAKALINNMSNQPANDARDTAGAIRGFVVLAGAMKSMGYEDAAIDLAAALVTAGRAMDPPDPAVADLTALSHARLLVAADRPLPRGYTGPDPSTHMIDTWIPLRLPTGMLPLDPDDRGPRISVDTLTARIVPTQ